MKILNRKMIPALMVVLLTTAGFLPFTIAQTNNSNSSTELTAVSHQQLAQFITRQNPKGKVIYDLLTYKAAMANLDLELAMTQQSLEKKQSYLNPLALARKFLSLASIGSLFTPKYAGLPYLLTSIQSLFVLFDQKNYDETKVLNQLSMIERQSNLLMQDLDLTPSERAQIIYFRNSLNAMGTTLTAKVSSNSFRTNLSKTELGSVAVAFVAGILTSRSGGSKVASLIVPWSTTLAGVTGVLNTGTELFAGFKSSDRALVLGIIANARTQLRINSQVLDQSLRAYAN